MKKKKNPFDFALWKKSLSRTHNEMVVGVEHRVFPGWHLECSATVPNTLANSLIFTGVAWT
ncbi:MAG: hypothetical protein MZV63_62900 [Marinilabiliales bacterium]|nr:hypothetical protein [Marinilabiliales bacterium]